MRKSPAAIGNTRARALFQTFSKTMRTRPIFSLDVRFRHRHSPAIVACISSACCVVPRQQDCRIVPRLAPLILLGWLAGFFVPAHDVVFAQDRPTRVEVWDLKLGVAVDVLPNEFSDHACGTNGGPPSTPLRDFRDFRRCRPEPSGLREVYFRYDDELEYWAKANDLPTEIERFSGTKVYNFPVVLSALFNESGILAGLRVI